MKKIIKLVLMTVVAVSSFSLYSCESEEDSDALYVATILLPEDDAVMERSQLVSSVMNDGYDIWAKMDEDSCYIWLYKDNSWVREKKDVVSSLCSMEEFFKGAWYVMHGGDSVLSHSDHKPYILPDDIKDQYFIIEEIKGDTAVLTPITCPYNESGDIVDYKTIADRPKIEHIWKTGLDIKEGYLIFE